MEDKGETKTTQSGSGEVTPYIDLPSRFDRWEPVVEVIATIVLAFATLATAWSGYQAARWGGVQASSYSEAGAFRTESTRASSQAGQLVQVDIGLFTNWINAFSAGSILVAHFCAPLVCHSATPYLWWGYGNQKMRLGIAGMNIQFFI